MSVPLCRRLVPLMSIDTSRGICANVDVALKLVVGYAVQACCRHCTTPVLVRLPTCKLPEKDPLVPARVATVVVPVMFAPPADTVRPLDELTPAAVSVELNAPVVAESACTLELPALTVKPLEEVRPAAASVELNVPVLAERAATLVLPVTVRLAGAKEPVQESVLPSQVRRTS